MLRNIGGSVYLFLIKLLFDINLTDTQCGFKFIAYENINSLANELSIEGFMYDLDLITLCKKRNLEVKEIPIRYVFNENSSVSLIKDPLFMLFEMFKIRKRLKKE